MGEESDTETSADICEYCGSWLRNEFSQCTNCAREAIDEAVERIAAKLDKDRTSEEEPEDEKEFDFSDHVDALEVEQVPSWEALAIHPEECQEPDCFICAWKNCPHHADPDAYDCFQCPCGHNV
jgi:hypothetical protein